MPKSTAILGLNAWHPDSSACLVVDGELVAAAEEERFRRVKHWSGLPVESVRWCLEEAGLEPEALDWVAVNRDPRASLAKKALFTVRRRPGLSFVKDRLANASHVGDVSAELGAELDVGGPLPARLARVEHHRAHLASSYLVSPFEQAAACSVDGFGDFASAAWGSCRGAEIALHGRVSFPHSLGLFYLALTQYLGFPSYGDEYKVMGMGAYGEPRYTAQLRKVARERKGGRFELDLRYFRHHSDGVKMGWAGGGPTLERAFGPELEALLGPARQPDEPLEQRHFDLAASVQERYEELLFHLLEHVAAETGERRLALSGGCAMNGLANGKIVARTPFDELYVPPAPGDAGGAIGAALDVWCGRLGGERRFRMDHAYLGPRFGADVVARLLEERSGSLKQAGCRVRLVADQDELCRSVAGRIASGAVVGWFQDRMEWGPRALGNRSILADPRRADMRELLNAKIKLRESFRPFAPSILAERAADWFEEPGDVPFMLEIRSVREERRGTIPAVTHVDGSGRLQTVDGASNPLYHRLIRAFADETDVPLLLNTSFNENEPVVCRPDEALECFLRTNMDALALGSYWIERSTAA